MAQGKFKAPKNASKVNKKQKQSGQAFTRRSNAPIKSKKGKYTENQKIKDAISRTVNQKMEHELRGRASDTVARISSAQKAVADHHKALAEESAASIKVQGDNHKNTDQKME
ncbi:hypothetical protein ACFFRR_011626 [Megaselia abdita]